MADTFTSMLRVTAREREIAHVTVRGAQFAVGRPLELDAESPRIAALEYVLGGLAAELVNGLRHFAWRRRVEIDDVEALVTGELHHVLAYLEVAAEDGPTSIDRVHIRLFVASPDEAGVRRLWEDLPNRLPLVRSLGAAFPIQLELTVTA